MSLEERYRRDLVKLRQQYLWRQAQVYDGNDFISNDYLSLRYYHPYLQFLKTADKLPATGSSGSRYLSGFHAALAECESMLAGFYSAKQTFLFPAGYLANISVFTTLCSPDDIILYDELCHASIKDGIRLSQAKAYPWRHLDLNDLQKKISRLRKPNGNVFIASETIYSMDGDCINLLETLSLCEHENAWLILDEAHSVGLLGPQGRGLAYGTTSPHLLCVMVGFGKAFALSGGALLFYNTTAAEYFAQKARPLVYSTAPSPRFCKQITLAHYFFLEWHNTLYRELKDKLHYFVNCAQNAGFGISNLHPIQIIKMNSRTKALQLAHFLQQHHIATKAIVPPTVRAGRERLRLIVHRENKESEIKNLWQLITQFQDNNL